MDQNRGQPPMDVKFIIMWSMARHRPLLKKRGFGLLQRWRTVEIGFISNFSFLSLCAVWALEFAPL